MNTDTAVRAIQTDMPQEVIDGLKKMQQHYQDLEAVVYNLQNFTTPQTTAR